jgi:hypothetical protein
MTTDDVEQATHRSQNHRLRFCRWVDELVENSSKFGVSSVIMLVVRLLESLAHNAADQGQ